jgi:hypothetical protein
MKPSQPKKKNNTSQTASAIANPMLIPLIEKLSVGIGDAPA